MRERQVTRNSHMCGHVSRISLDSLRKKRERCGVTTFLSAVAWGGAGGARAPPIIWQTQKNIH